MQEALLRVVICPGISTWQTAPIKRKGAYFLDLTEDQIPKLSASE
jgi:hypothetical protein